MHATTHPRLFVDDEIAGIATRQGGVIARRQLAELGLGAGAIEHRVARGRLHPVPGHRAVFAVGHTARGPRTALWAAHLAIGPDSVLSHRSAAALLELRPTSSTYVELTVPGSSRRRKAIRVHRTTWLPPNDLDTIDGLPVTKVARTLLDLGAVLPYRAVERAFDQAEVMRALDHAEIQRVLHEGAGRPGAAKLRAVVARDAAGSTVTDNGLGELMLAIIRRARLPEPICQYPVLEYRADFCWPAARLIVETDGRWHETRSGIVRDARRDVRLQNAGWRVLRFPRIEVVANPAYVEAAIRAALART
jgi:very-short-patch-repair endonuclease